MSAWRPGMMSSVALAVSCLAHAQATHMTLPRQVVAGSAFTIGTTGSGKATLTFVGLSQVLRQDVQLGQPIPIAEGVLHNAGHYTAVLAGDSVHEDTGFVVVASSHVSTVSLLAKPSRVPTGLHGGITGAVYVFDAYKNLITSPATVTFELSGAGATQTRTTAMRNGSAWTQMDSAAKEGAADFSARVGDVTSTRIIREVPGEPCSLRMSARPGSHGIELQTDPLRDCGGNAVPDGTIVTFTEVYDGRQTTVDVPLKRGIAQAELPAYNGAKISAATGVVLGNEIRWSRP